MELDSLDSIVKDICSEFGDTKFTKYTRVLKNAVRTLRDLNMYALPNEDSFELTVEDPLSVYLPKEIIKPTRVGVCNGGMISEIFYNNDLCAKLPERFAEVCCPEEDTTITTNAPNETAFYNVDVNHPYYFGFSSFGAVKTYSSSIPWNERYWVRPGLSRFGSYRHNKKHDRIEFSSDSGLSVGDTVLVVGKTDIMVGQVQDDNIPIVVYRLLMYSAKEHIFAENRLDSQSARQNFFIEWRKIKRFYKKMSLGEWRHRVEKSKRPTVKR